ncbi:MAG: GNAT family N-acetyltransferase, partial [Anaerolineae bacterium]|nr:GNAT family N-acetyltransferase [Anaerolineae bacterium]
YHAQIYSDPAVTRYLPGGAPRPKEGTQQVLEFSIQHGEEHGYTLWAVIDKASRAFLGHCGLVTLQNGVEVEVAYAFGQAYWGKGYAPEAAHASLRYGFESGALDIIIALAVPENMASQRVMQKIGMQYQGTTEQYYGTMLALYTLSKKDFRAGAAMYRVTV